MKRNIIQENIFLTLGKLLAALRIKNIERAVNALPDDPEIKAARRDFERANKDAEKLRRDFCKVNPDHEKCKQRSGDR